jgi:hypothetical protein
LAVLRGSWNASFFVEATGAPDARLRAEAGGNIYKKAARVRCKTLIAAGRKKRRAACAHQVRHDRIFR